VVKPMSFCSDIIFTAPIILSGRITSPPDRTANLVSKPTALLIDSKIGTVPKHVM